MSTKRTMSKVLINEPVCGDCNKSMKFSNESKSAVMFNCAKCPNSIKVDVQFLDGGKHDSKKFYHIKGKNVEVQFKYDLKIKEEEKEEDKLIEVS